MPRLLAIDDSERIHRLLKDCLRHDHVEIHSATTGREGLEMARELHPEVILLEIDLPEMEGFEILSQLKSNSETYGIPVIVISASNDTKTKVRSFDLGAMDFVTKPFDLAELRARLRSAVRMRQMILMLAQRAQIDGLTGLWNRAHFDLRLRQEIAEASRHRSPLSLIMCDLDMFKEVNDLYGHPYGDHVLQVFSEILTSHRLSDIACRYGGEEFAIILPRTDVEEATAVAQRLRAHLSEHEWSDQPTFNATASFGICDLSMCKEPFAETMVDLADKALYAAKQTGRDCIMISPRENEEGPARVSA